MTGQWTHRRPGPNRSRTMRISSLAAIFAITGICAPAWSADLEAGKAKATGVCASCHGVSGISASDAFPNLAGQKAAYLGTALKAYREGTRKAPIMNNMAANLSDQDIENLAAWFSGLKPTP